MTHKYGVMSFLSTLCSMVQTRVSKPLPSCKQPYSQHNLVTPCFLSIRHKNNVLPPFSLMCPNSCSIYQHQYLLTHFSSVFNFYNPRKRQKIKGFLKFSRGIEMDHWIKMGYHERASLSAND